MIVSAPLFGTSAASAQRVLQNARHFWLRHE
jgi:hypothetical protein